MTELELKQLGFKRKWASDRSVYWMQLNIKSFINGCHICVENGKYTIWAVDIDNRLNCTLTRGEASESELKSLIKKLSV